MLYDKFQTDDTRIPWLNYTVIHLTGRPLLTAEFE